MQGHSMPIAQLMNNLRHLDGVLSMFDSDTLASYSTAFISDGTGWLCHRFRCPAASFKDNLHLIMILES